MDDKKLLSILMQGAEAWNAWRGKNPRLSHPDLRRVDLRGADLKNVKLSGAVLTKAILSRASLAGASLSQANLPGIDLSKADLSNANLSHANFSGANLSYASFLNADLFEADLWNADLRGADFTGADLTNTMFRNNRVNAATRGLERLTDEQCLGLVPIDEESIEPSEQEPADQDEKGEQEPTRDDVVPEGTRNLLTRIVVYERRLITKESDLRLVEFFLSQIPNTFESDEIADAYRGLHALVRDLVKIIGEQSNEIAVIREAVGRRDARIDAMEKRLTDMEVDLAKARDRSEPLLRSALQTSVNVAAGMGTTAVIGIAAFAVARTFGMSSDEILTILKLIRG